jgi:hypothetical protein
MPAEDSLDRVRRVCLALPEAFEQEAWGAPTFRVRKRIFAMFASAGKHHGGGRDGLWLAAPLGCRRSSCDPRRTSSSCRRTWG